MRLNSDQTRAIVEATRELAGDGARVRLFGLRLDDDAKGGDIDLLIECPQPVTRPVWVAALITARPQRALSDRRIDVLVVDPCTALESVHRVALAEGVVLQA